MVAGPFNGRDAVMAINVAKGSETLGDFVAERVCLRFGDDPFTLPSTDVETNETGAV